jgi:hypothetical protein
MEQANFLSHEWNKYAFKEIFPKSFEHNAQSACFFISGTYSNPSEAGPSVTRVTNGHKNANRTK